MAWDPLATFLSHFLPQRSYYRGTLDSKLEHKLHPHIHTSSIYPSKIGISMKEAAGVKGAVTGGADDELEVIRSSPSPAYRPPGS